MKLYIYTIISLIICGTYTDTQAAAQNDKPASKKTSFLKSFRKKSKQKTTRLIPSIQPASSSDQPASSKDIPVTDNLDTLNRKLRIAIHTDNVHEVEQLLSLGADANYFQTPEAPDIYHDPVHCAPLFYAAECANPAIMSALLAAGAKVDCTSGSNGKSENKGLTPLQIVVFSSYRQARAQLRVNVELLINAGADANVATIRPTLIAPNSIATYMLHHIARTNIPNRDAFAIIKALFNGGAQKNVRDCFEDTATECAAKIAHDCPDPLRARRFALRAKFIQVYPGPTLQTRILLDMLVRTCSNNKATATAALADLRLLKELMPTKAKLIEPFMEDTSEGLHVPAYKNPDPFIRENMIGRMRYNVDSIAIWPRQCKNARRWQNGKCITPRR